VTVHLLGIRHHGPGSARSVLRALDQIRPTAVLVEIPVDAGPALGHVGDGDLRPPVSLLSWVVAEPGRAAFAPFATFSPEWQALRWAHAHGVEARPIDLPFAVSLAASDRSDPELVADAVPVDPLRDLARAAGDRDPERWWEDVIEHRGDGEPAFAAVAEAMAAARLGTVPTRREQRREAHMRRAIRGAVRDGHDEIVVVCGAWHVPALDVASTTVGADSATLRGMPRAKVGVAWVPWTHRRLTAVSGYGAGVESPGWYAHVFDHPGRDGVARFFVGAARTLREHGQSASPDHLIAGSRLADAFASLRDRPRPGLHEVLDAADAVTGNVDLVRRELVVGDALGSVPDAAPQVPLAKDLVRQQRAARLRPETEERMVEIDLRTPTGRRKSLLLHRLLALEVTWGLPEAGRGSSGTFRETWRLRWEPELAVRLIERSALGTTVEAAATAALVERADAARSLVDLVAGLDRALLADLPGAVVPAVRRLADRAASDPDVGHLMDALVPLANALRYGDVRDTDASALGDVVEGMVIRVVAGVVPACAALDPDAAAVMAERLTGVQAALNVLNHPARTEAFPRVLAQLAEQRTGHGLVQGRATRLLHDGGHRAGDDIGRRLARALSAGTPPAHGAAFVEGFLAGSGTVLVHDVALLEVVDEWMCSLRPDAFHDVVALLRRTFGQFEPAERRQLMRILVDGTPPTGSGSPLGTDVDEDRAAAVLVTVRHLLGLPIPEPASGSGAP
jgi:hypothetical protein